MNYKTGYSLSDGSPRLNATSLESEIRGMATAMEGNGILSDVFRRWADAVTAIRYNLLTEILKLGGVLILLAALIAVLFALHPTR